MIRETLVLIAFVKTFSSAWYYVQEFRGELNPMDPDVCTTQDITFTCTLFDLPRTNFYIGFTVKNESTHGEEVIDSAHVTVINETVSQLTLYNVSLENKTAPIYSIVGCYYWDVLNEERKNEKDPTLRLGVPSMARIYPIPEGVQDFNCIVNNYVSMSCSWDFGKNYGIKENAPDVTFLWKLPTFSSSWNACPSGNSTQEGHCTWRNSYDGYFKNGNITILLTLEKQKCAENVTQIFTVDTSTIVKPNPVVDLTAKPLNSSCILVSWSSGTHYPKQHMVTVNSKLDNYRKEARFNTTRENEDLPQKQIFCNLRPFREYRFAVSMKPIGTYSGYFSDVIECVAKTYADRPSASPEVTEGGYSWRLRECQGNSHRYVHTFWKQLKDEDKNGEMKGLVAKFIPKTALQDVFAANWAEDLTYGRALLRCNTNYVFSIVARNKNGTSERASTLEIDSATSGKVRPQFIVESDNSSKVHVSWSYTGPYVVHRFTVAWCRNKNGDCDNKFEVGWKVFSANTTEADIQMNSSYARDFLYGVSVVTDRGSGGLEWEDCVYRKDAAPTKQPQNVVVSEGPEDNTLIVTWDKLMCMSGEPYIDKYNIQIKNLEDGHQKSIDVAASAEARVLLMDLEEDQPYEVTVRGITKNGLYGPESESKKGIPVNRRLKPDAIVAISMSVMVGAIFAGVGCFCVIRRCKTKAKKVIKEAGNITIPDVTGLQYNNSLTRQDSADSGYDMSPTADKFQALEKLSDSEFTRPEDYHFVTNWKRYKECMTTDISKLDTQLLCSLSEAPNSPKNSREPADTSQKSSENLKLILDIPKPLVFTYHPERDMPSKENANADSNLVDERKLDYVEALGLSGYCSEILRGKQNGYQPQKNCSTDIELDVKDITDFQSAEQVIGVLIENQTPPSFSKLFTQIPCPKEFKVGNYPEQQDEKNRQNCKPFSINSSSSDKIQLEHLNIQNADLVGISGAFNQSLSSLPECLNIPDTSSVVEVSDRCKTEAPVRVPDANRRDPDCSVSYIAAVVDVSSRIPEPLTFDKTAVTQTPYCDSNITSIVKNNTPSERIFSMDSMDSQNAVSTSFDQDVMPKTSLEQIPSSAVQNHSNLQTDRLEPTCDFEGYVPACNGHQSGLVKHKHSNSDIVAGNGEDSDSCAHDNDSYIPVDASEDRADVPDCVFEDIYELEKHFSLVRPVTSPSSINSETCYVSPVLENGVCIPMNNRVQSDATENRLLQDCIQSSNQSSNFPSSDTNILLNYVDLQPQPNSDEEINSGYVDEIFAGIPQQDA